MHRIRVLNVFITYNIRLCEIDIRNPKYTTFTKLVQVRNFITFELKVIRHEERDTHNLSMLTAFTSAPNHVRHPICKLLIWPQRAPKINLSVRTQELNSLLFSQIPKILSPRLRCMTSFTPPGPIFLSDVFILTSLNDTSSPRAREHLC